ncbi:HAD-IIB family hydrolase [Sphingomicrobium sp. XHP0239]|uniref:HAD-IIB family hydrolase n=1 Tax=Sphingomicrobium maritimum TaxID=3133972 RepID=UPI0031CC6EC4
MRIGLIALGGCIKAPPVAYGLTPDTGGHITYLLGEAQALARTPGVTGVDIYTRRFDDRALGPFHALAEERVSERCRIVRIDSGDPRYLAKERLAADLPAFTHALLDHFETNGAPDVLHAHFADAAEAAFAARDRFGCRVVYTAHSLALDKAEAMPESRASLCPRLEQERAAVAGADAIIGSSRDECERQLLGYKGARVETIHQVPPGIERRDVSVGAIAKAREAIAPFLTDPERPFIFAVARPVEKKNLVSLVRMMGDHRSLREAANLVILAGLRSDIAEEDAESASVHRALLEAIDRHDLYGHVAIPKRHDGETVEGLYRLASRQRGIFANPALFEPYGLTIVEAASHGVPTVATARGGPRDIIETLGHGVAIDPENEPAFAKAMIGLLQDPERWEIHARRGRERAAQWSWDDYAGEFVRIVRDLDEKPVAVAPPIELLALCDIDNTLTGCRRGAARLSRLLSAQKGWRFGVATGRSLQQARRILGEWDLPSPTLLITSVGSEIYWRRGGSLERDEDYSAHIAHDWHPEGVIAALAEMDGLEPQDAHEQRTYKRSYFFDDPDVPGRVERALEQAGVAARVIASHDRLLDVLPARAGKGAAMRWAANRMGLDERKIVAVGDSGNDADMLESCANAVLVSNHSHELSYLTDRANVRVARHPHALGVVEGLVAAAQAERRVAS